MLGLSAAGKMLNKTIFSSHPTQNSTAHGDAAAGGANATNANTSANSTYTAASAAAASAAALNSMKSLTLDISSSARSAVGNLKWSSSTGQK